MYPMGGAFASETNDYGGNYGQDLWSSTDEYSGLGGAMGGGMGSDGLSSSSSSSMAMNGSLHGGGMPGMNGMSQFNLDQARLDAFDSLEMNPMVTDANLYIKNIDYDVSDDMLYTVFSCCGEIMSHHIVRDANKRSRGFGFMSFRTADQAKRAIIELNGRFIGKKPIVVMLHIKKEQRRLQKHFLQGAMGMGPQSLRGLSHHGPVGPMTGPLRDQMYLQQQILLGLAPPRGGGGGPVGPYDSRMARSMGLGYGGRGGMGGMGAMGLDGLGDDLHGHAAELKLLQQQQALRRQMHLQQADAMHAHQEERLMMEEMRLLQRIQDAKANGVGAAGRMGGRYGGGVGNGRLGDDWMSDQDAGNGNGNGSGGSGAGMFGDGARNGFGSLPLPSTGSGSANDLDGLLGGLSLAAPSPSATGASPAVGRTSSPSTTAGPAATSAAAPAAASAATVAILAAEPAAQRRMLLDALQPLIAAHKPFLARTLAEYLVAHASAAELCECLDEPVALIPHYISVAVNMLKAAGKDAPAPAPAPAANGINGTNGFHGAAAVAAVGAVAGGGGAASASGGGAPAATDAGHDGAGTGTGTGSGVGVAAGDESADAGSSQGSGGEALPPPPPMTLSPPGRDPAVTDAPTANG